LLGVTVQTAEKEVDTCIQRIFTYAAYADKYDGRVHDTVKRHVTLAMNEALGIMGIACPPQPSLLGFISTLMPAIAMGNTVVIVPSARGALLATDFYQLLETSDVPDGVVNIVTGNQEDLMDALAKHDNVDAIWYFGSEAGSKQVELLSADNMKRTWVNYGKVLNWFDAEQGQGEHFLRHATQIKNIWIPYGE